MQTTFSPFCLNLSLKTWWAILTKCQKNIMYIVRPNTLYNIDIYIYLRNNIAVIILHITGIPLLYQRWLQNYQQIYKYIYYISILSSKSITPSISAGSAKGFRIYSDTQALENVNRSLVSNPARCPKMSAASQQSPAPVRVFGSTLIAILKV